MPEPLNSTFPYYFTLSAYIDVGGFRYLLFLIILCLFLCIIGANSLLVYVISVNRSLHEPMYIFLCSLFINEVYGSSALFPLLLVQILSHVHQVAVPLCFLQNFCLFAYGGSELLILAVMSYDRYLAICCPLDYQARMTPNRISFLIALTWVCPLFFCVVMTSLSATLHLCNNVIQKVYCDNHSITKSACTDTSLINAWGLLITSLSVFVPLVIIFYSYVLILKVCFSGSKQTRQKAVSTCSPHIASLLNFSFGACFEILQSRFDMSGVPNVLRIILSLYWLTCQPLFNPLLYGLNMSKIRIICKSLFLSRV
ncbi:olfactory receptor 10A3-like [Periophthalmus magnuspinnatus]|uniref:olfactory receptor 10A3-like n=1 Tax=Periophthalmus magnuspinnatus TaxID=409849 RepID=UPI00145A0763|nr:olfactory receptor 10A3-like [Periophthalmus magnuspinnatus]